MATEIIKVPDIGADSGEVVEILVAVGDPLEVDQSLVVMESDKASLEVPSPAAGRVVSIKVAVGDQLSEGMDLIEIEIADTADEPTETEGAEVEAEEVVAKPAAETAEVTESTLTDSLYRVPDLGTDEAEIVEVPVSVGDSVEEGDTLIVVETDKASVEVPAESAGEITAIHVEVGDSIGQGDKLVGLLGATPPVAGSVATSEQPAESESKAAASQPPKVTASPAKAEPQVGATSGEVHAGPGVRKLARELGVDLAKVKSTGRRGRILKDDIHAYVKQQLSAARSTSATSGAGIPEIPAVDWRRFGEVDVQPMSRINKATAANMTRSWLNVPHVTQFDDADVTDLEQYRSYLKPEAVARAVKMTPLAFLLKASAIALGENPKFNTALHHNGDDLVERRFFHIAIAVDTPSGLMVPVISDVDQKDIWELASDVSVLAGKAKEGALSPGEMRGAGFTISSLGAVGGTGFTPIVPAPQVGILGVSKTSVQPVWDGGNFVPRKMMPLALSYDHRVVNGADAGKFMTCLVDVLGDLNRIWNG